MKLTKLADLFSIPYYAYLKELYPDTDGEKWSELDANIDEDLDDFFSQLDHKSIKPIETKGHDIRMVNWINEYANLGFTNSTSTRDLLYCFKELIRENISTYRWSQQINKRDEEDSFPSMHLIRSDLLQCSHDGKERILLKYDKDNDQLILMSHKLSREENKVVDLTACSIKEYLIKTSITFPTGRLIMADAISDLFEDLTEDKKQFNSVNFVQGRIDFTEYDRTNFNFLQVYLSVASGNLIPEKNRYIFGHDESLSKKSPYPHLGCESHAFILIEEDRLIEILQGSGMSLEEAKAHIEVSLQGKFDHNEAKRITIKPGTYDVYYEGDDCQNFGKTFRAAGHKLSKKYYAYLVLERRIDKVKKSLKNDWSTLTERHAQLVFGQNYGKSLDEIKEKIKAVQTEMKQYKRDDSLWKVYFKSVRMLHAQKNWLEAKAAKVIS